MARSFFRLAHLSLSFDTPRTDLFLIAYDESGLEIDRIPSRATFVRVEMNLALGSFV